ncbi:MAG: tyrosine-type recombinase/integrase [Candidatus Micrarchaeota archaeon]
MANKTYPEAKFTKPLLLDILANMTNTSIAVHSHKKMKSIFKEILRQPEAARRKWISEYEEQALVKKFERPEPLPVYLNQEQYSLLLNLIRTYKKKWYDRYEGMVLFAKATGARPGEICKGVVGDIDLSLEIFTVKKTKQKKEHVYHILDSECLEYLRRHLAGKKPNEPIFVSNWGRAYTVEGFSKVIRTLATEAGIKLENGKSVISGHKMRHTHGVIAAQNNVPEPAIREQLGHSDSRITSIYTAIAGNDVRKSYNMENHQNGVAEDPLKVLQLRFAKGEITKEQYIEMKKLLS